MSMYDNYGAPAYSGVTPAPDQNASTPPHSTGDPMEKPDFIREWEQELISVRRELSDLWAEEYGVKYGTKSCDIPCTPYGAKKDMNVSGMEREAEYSARKRKLEDRESELQSMINQYKYVASLGDAPAVEDEPGEPTNAARSGATDGVAAR